MSNPNDSMKANKKAEIEAELGRLTRELRRVEATEEKERSHKTKVLVPKSPSPRKIHTNCVAGSSYSDKIVSAAAKSQAARAAASSINSSAPLNSSNHLNTIQDGVDRPRSKLVEELEVARQETKNKTIIKATKKSTSFEISAEKRPSLDKRASDLTVNVQVQLGPIEYKLYKKDGLDFSEYEPNSKVRLIKRYMSHQTLQDHLSDRYIVRINEFYALVRPDVSRFSANKEWTMPLVGDWVLFGVIGQKSDYKTTTPHIPSQVNKFLDSSSTPNEENINDQEESTSKPSSFNKPLNERKNQNNNNRVGKKYVTFKLIDMTSNEISNSGSGIVNMILFESDSSVPNSEESIKKTYIGGSRGAYEKYWKEQPGTLIGVLNPKILKSRRTTTTTTCQEYLTEALTITPESSKSLIVIGKSKDLGACIAKRWDTGQECGAWCDLRSLNSPKSLPVCHFHLQKQVSKVRANRPEFFAGTSGMNTHTGKKFGTNEFDASTKTGLLPSQKKATYVNGLKTYICGGGGTNQQNNNNNNKNEREKMKKKQDRFIEPIDVEKLEGLRLKRKRELEEIQINKLFDKSIELNENNNYGLKCIKDAKKKIGSNNNNDDDDQLTSCEQNETSPDTISELKESSEGRRVYTTAAIRAIGYDPCQKLTSSSKKTKKSSQNATSSSYDDLLTSKIHFKTSLPRSIPPTSSSSSHLQSSSASAFKKLKFNVPALLSLDDEDDDEDEEDDLIILPPKNLPP